MHFIPKSGQIPDMTYPYPHKFMVYVNNSMEFQIENPEPKPYSDIIGYFSANLENYDVALGQFRSFVHRL